MKSRKNDRISDTGRTLAREIEFAYSFPLGFTLKRTVLRWIVILRLLLKSQRRVPR